MTINDQGNITAMWRNWLDGSRDMYVATNEDGGKSFSPAKKLGSGTWKLQGCPMDGGALAFDSEGKMHTVWRREKAIFASDGSGDERMLAASGLQPIVVMGGKGACFLWQNGGGLMLQAGESAPRQLAQKASYVAGASLPENGVVVVWQSNANDRKTLLAEVID